MTGKVAVTIVNKKGLHARAAAKFVKVVSAYPAQVMVSKAGEAEMPEVVGTSILGLMMLGADAGSVLHLRAEGDKAGEALQAIKELVENRFGESE